MTSLDLLKLEKKINALTKVEARRIIYLLNVIYFEVFLPKKKISSIK